jgi:serine/threonine protein kinase
VYLLFFFQAWQQDGYFFCLTELCCRATCRELIDDFRSQNSPSQRHVSSISRLSPSMVSETSTSGSCANGIMRLLPECTIWKICHDIAAGLRHVHSHGLVHNDIKPSNIFLFSDSRFGALCKIGDFGMTREIGSSDDGEEGDQKYMASEVLDSGKKESSADMLSLGLSLYELAANLSFDLPSDGPRWHELRQGRHSLDVPSCRSSELKRVILSMMAPNPTRRPLAREILEREIVVTSGSSRDIFLHDYIHDIDQLEKLEEDHGAIRHCAEQTPRNAPSRPRSCSPSIGSLPSAPLIYSPDATAPVLEFARYQSRTSAPTYRFF